ncbi:MAG TPA: hypothetical protein VG165_18370 [Solirubrobacteraceae bacterium]|jgi:hypothetical protein|nr:hypothetical protein [Solirubrobacteraceae bacterium]
MPFLEVEPFTTAQATYVESEHAYLVTVSGKAPKITSGIALVEMSAPPHLEVEVKGWTGPLERGTETYTVHGVFRGPIAKTIKVHGSNRTETIEVHILASEQVPA